MLGLSPGGCEEVLERKGPSAWENIHPHARTCLHSEKCVLDFWENKFPGGTGMHDLPSPWQGFCLSSMEGEAYLGDRAPPDLCQGGNTCFSRAGGGGTAEGQAAGRGRCGFSLLPKNHRYLVAKGHCT